MHESACLMHEAGWKLRLTIGAARRRNRGTVGTTGRDTVTRAAHQVQLMVQNNEQYGPDPGPSGSPLQCRKDCSVKPVA